MQKYVYPMFSPHPPARFYKKFTGNVPVEFENNEVITVQQNRYVFVCSIRWVEETAKDSYDEQPVSGLLIGNSYLTIKTNSLTPIGDGDIIELPKDTRFGGLWVVQDGVSVDYTYTPKQVQTFQHLPLSSVG